MNRWRTACAFLGVPEQPRRHRAKVRCPVCRHPALEVYDTPVAANNAGPWCYCRRCRRGGAVGPLLLPGWPCDRAGRDGARRYYSLERRRAAYSPGELRLLGALGLPASPEEYAALPVRPCPPDRRAGETRVKPAAVWFPFGRLPGQLLLVYRLTGDASLPVWAATMRPQKRQAGHPPSRIDEGLWGLGDVVDQPTRATKFVCPDPLSALRLRLEAARRAQNPAVLALSPLGTAGWTSFVAVRGRAVLLHPPGPPVWRLIAAAVHGDLRVAEAAPYDGAAEPSRYLAEADAAARPWPEYVSTKLRRLTPDAAWGALQALAHWGVPPAAAAEAAGAASGGRLATAWHVGRGDRRYRCRQYDVVETDSGWWRTGKSPGLICPYQLRLYPCARGTAIWRVFRGGRPIAQGRFVGAHRLRIDVRSTPIDAWLTEVALVAGVPPITRIRGIEAVRAAMAFAGWGFEQPWDV